MIAEKPEPLNLFDRTLVYRLVKVGYQRLWAPICIHRLSGKNAGWRVLLKRRDVVVIDRLISDEGRDPAISLEVSIGFLQEKGGHLLKDFTLKNRGGQRTLPKGIDTGMAGVCLSWVCKYNGQGYEDVTLVMSAGYQLGPGDARQKVVRVGNRNTVTQKRLDAALRLGRAYRYHHLDRLAENSWTPWPSEAYLLEKIQGKRFKKIWLSDVLAKYPS